MKGSELDAAVGAAGAVIVQPAGAERGFCPLLVRLVLLINALGTARLPQ